MSACVFCIVVIITLIYWGENLYHNFAWGGQFMTGWYFSDHLVINGTCYVSIFEIIYDHFAVWYIHLLPGSSEQTLRYFLPMLPRTRRAALLKFPRPKALQGFVCMR